MKALSGIIIESQKTWKPVVLRILHTGFLFVLTLATINCGGSSTTISGGGNNGGSTSNPVPSLTSLSPSSAQTGSSAITLTVVGSGFRSGSVVKWNDSNRDTVYVSSLQLRATITATDLANSGTAAITVFNPTPGGGTSAALTFMITPVSITTTSLPSAFHNISYNYALQASGGISPYTWSLVSGTLPSGISLSSSGVLSGTPSSITSAVFAVQVRDSVNTPGGLIRTFELIVLGSNDSCPTATSAISNGVIRASISPHGDVDVYSFQGTAGNQITAEIYAQRLQLYAGSTTQDSFLDSFLELLDSNCNQLTYNDDINSEAMLDSRISNYTLPSTGTYYLRVSDVRGDGRPDFIYELHLSGAN